MEEPYEQRNLRGEWLKFLLLALVFMGVVLVIAFSRSWVFGRVLPTILGLNEPYQITLPFVDSGTDPSGQGGEPTATPEAVATEVPAETAVDQPTPTTTPEPTATAVVTHTVQPGDTLFKIAQQYSITIADIVTANSITNPNRIAVGDKLIIPKP